MQTEIDEIVIKGVTYVPKGSDLEPAEKMDGLDYAVVRTQNAGCFAGYIKEVADRKAVILKARRIWYWDGAASLSQLAMEGTNKPENCKFPQEVPLHTVFEVIEVIPASEKARVSIQAVPVWKK